MLDINDCLGSPCNNGGTCTDGIATYSCACPPGFTGTDCEISEKNIYLKNTQILVDIKYKLL